MEHEKKIFNYNIVKLVVYATLAVLTFIFRETLIEYLKYFIGTLMLIYGIEEIFFEIFFEKKNFYKRSKVYLGFIELALGLVLVFANISFEETCVIWATWSIMREAHEVEEILSEIKNIIPKVLSGVESLVVIVLSIMLIIEPGEHHAMTHLYLLLFELILTPLTPMLDYIFTKKNEQKEEAE